MSDTQKHKKLNVPNLRFPGFEGEWENITIAECCTEFQSGKFINADAIADEGAYPVYGGNGLRGYAQSYNHDGDYTLIGRQGALCGNVRFVKGKTYITEHAIAVKASPENDTRFLAFLFDKMNLRQYSDQSAQPGLAVNKLLKLRIDIPRLEEQTKISKFLSCLDERISIQNKLIDHYESLIRAIILRSQSSTSRRKVYLHEILTERKELNEQGYDICSVSVSKGVVNQVEYLGRSFAAKETAHYHVVHKGDIVYTKSPTGEFPYGIIKQSYLDAPVAVSPLYGVYEPIDYLTGVYLHHFFCSPQNAKNYLHKLIQKGAKNTINITNQHFLDNYISIPESDTLQSIVAIIETLSKRVDLEKESLSLFIEQKAYLMSNLFI